MTDAETKTDDGKKTNAELSKEVAALSAQNAELVGVVSELHGAIENLMTAINGSKEEVATLAADVAQLVDKPETVSALPAATEHLLEWVEKVLRKYHHNDEPEMKTDGPDASH